MSSLPPARRAGGGALVSRRPMTAQTLEALRRQFLARGEAPEGMVPPQILRSWQRCAALGLDMETRPRIEPIGRAELRERHERAERLRQAAANEIRVLHEEARSAGGIVILTDAEGLILDALGSLEFAQKAARVALKPGVTWMEATTGTNAIGAALAERRDISVLGGEHFFESHRILSCTAAPIVGPCGQIMGAIDLSNHAEVQQTHAPALVRRAVAAIEHRLFAATFPSLDVVHLHPDPSELGSPREGLLAFEGDRLVGATRQALALLELEWDVLGAARWNEIFAGGRSSGGDVARMTTARGTPVFGRLRRPAEAAPRAARPAPAEVEVPAEVAVPAMVPASPPAVVAPTVRAKVEFEPIWDEPRRRALARATRLIDAEVPILVQGETGTGKEVFARALHAAGRRRDRPFVAVNCAALPEGLIEAELFGYEDGAFTGARKRGSKGLMREADGGVLFLDEIGDMPLTLQTRLLRALQEREVTPLGGGRPVAVDFALICASHHGLAEAVERQAFRQDLYFRIAQYTVELEPLRQRSDLREVIARLWRSAALPAVPGVAPAGLTPAALDCLAAHHWPGNFRQLTATLRTLAILAEPGEQLPVDALPADIRRGRAGSGSTVAAFGEASTPASGQSLDDLSLEAMRTALDACGGNVTRAAARLGVHRSTFYRRLPGERARHA